MQYFQWQTREEGRKTLKEFADYLGVNRPTLSLWMNGTREPDDTSLDKLAKRLGLEVFDAAGKPRPDPRLLYVRDNWNRISEEGKQRIADEAAKYSPDEADQKK